MTANAPERSPHPRPDDQPDDEAATGNTLAERVEELGAAIEEHFKELGRR
ncbi:hypothetical protein [Streptomyces sp. NPDC058872]